MRDGVNRDSVAVAVADASRDALLLAVGDAEVVALLLTVADAVAEVLVEPDGVCVRVAPTLAVCVCEAIADCVSVAVVVIQVPEPLADAVTVPRLRLRDAVASRAADACATTLSSMR